jgi:hypothetical protein
MNDEKRTSAKQNTVEVWCTKYALTTGTYKVRGKINNQGRDAAKPSFSVPSVGGNSLAYMLFHGDWHTTEAAALDRVKSMVAAKKRALVKQIEALYSIEHGLSLGNLPMIEAGK